MVAGHREITRGQRRSSENGTHDMKDSARPQRLNPIRTFAISTVVAIAAALTIALPPVPSALAQGNVVQGTVTQGNPAPAAAPALAVPSAPPAPAAATAPVTAPAAPPMSAPSEAAPSAAAPAPPNAMAPAAGQPTPGEHMIGGADLPEDLSPWGMFEAADLIVKAVIIGLAFASLVTWTVWLAKTLELRGARSEVRRDIRILNGVATFAQAHEQLRDGESPVAQLMQSAAAEIRLSANLRGEGLKERIALQLERIEMAVSRKVSRGTGVLATIGSTAPFVGLFEIGR